MGVARNRGKKANVSGEMSEKDADPPPVGGWSHSRLNWETGHGRGGLRPPALTDEERVFLMNFDDPSHVRRGGGPGAARMSSRFCTKVNGVWRQVDNLNY